MPEAAPRLRTAGLGLVVAGAVWLVWRALHPPPASEPEAFRARVAATPAWAAGVGALAGVVGVVGGVLGPILGMRIGGLLFVVSSIAFGLWILWSGTGLRRAAKPTAGAPVHDTAEGRIPAR